MAADADPQSFRPILSSEDLDWASWNLLSRQVVADRESLGPLFARAGHHAHCKERSDEAVIDIRALLESLFQHIPQQDGSKLNWLSDWADHHRTQPAMHSIGRTTETVLSSLAQGARLVISRSLLGQLLPSAVEVAVQTTGLTTVSLRHLVFATLRPFDAWRSLGVEASEAQWAEVRRLCVAWAVSDLGRSDDHRVWRSLIPPGERLITQSDDPALGDKLGRLPFAQVLAERIQEARVAELGRPGPNRAFMVHLHGPWGSGKSSILRFLCKEMEASEPPWVTVDFNAWQNQSLRPIWWSIINDIRRQALRQVGSKQRWRMRSIWWRWKTRADLLPGVIALALFAVAFGLAAKDIFSIVTAAIAAGGGVYALSRTVVFGSTHAARAYGELKTDPYTPVIKLFCRLVEAIDRPLLVCVDDVDRCDSGTVVDLLEGIQTLLRDAPVTYVVAGDRKWICASFEKRYLDFHDKISTPGRPLGYLFLDKLFQVSTAVPRMSSSVRDQFWGGLLQTGDAPEPQPEDVQGAERSVAGLTRHEDLQQRIDKAERPEQRQALRAAAALQITRSASLRASEHRFRGFAELLERNPRAMKRLVNALGMNQALAFLEGRDIAPEALARWTIIELRWPLLADWLSMNADASPECCPLKDLLEDADFQAVIGREGEDGRLDAATLRMMHE